ncbi:hypothetical protein HS9_02753 [Bacillus velezensis]|nr:hypothetical protein HS9_02753 [Bacillus velezensis]
MKYFILVLNRFVFLEKSRRRNHSHEALNSNEPAVYRRRAAASGIQHEAMYLMPALLL